MPRPRADHTHRVAVIDPNYESRERVRSMLAHDQCTCVTASDASDIVAMSARARRFSWVYLVCDGPVALAERQIASLRHAIAPDLPLLLAVPLAHVDAVSASMGPRDGVLGLPCAGMQLAARLVDFARLHKPRPRTSAALDTSSTAALHLQTGRWWR